jgi:hypothetical protein
MGPGGGGTEASAIPANSKEKATAKTLGLFITNETNLPINAF